jgi:hypothetical protein
MFPMATYITQGEYAWVGASSQESQDFDAINEAQNVAVQSAGKLGSSGRALSAVLSTSSNYRRSLSTSSNANANGYSTSSDSSSAHSPPLRTAPPRWPQTLERIAKMDREDELLGRNLPGMSSLDYVNCMDRMSFWGGISPGDE